MTAAEVEMAPRTTIVLEDGFGGGLPEQAVRFAVGAAEYGIDLIAANASRFLRWPRSNRVARSRPEQALFGG
jgi:hypothetical protein